MVHERHEKRWMGIIDTGAHAEMTAGSMSRIGGSIFKAPIKICGECYKNADTPYFLRKKLCCASVRAFRGQCVTSVATLFRVA